MNGNINFHQAVSAGGKVTIFVPPGEFDVSPIGATYSADMFTTENVLLLRIRTAEGHVMATNLDIRDRIAAGDPVYIAHLDPRLGYVMDQCRLSFDLVA